jgi:hypothetical protein
LKLTLRTVGAVTHFHLDPASNRVAPAALPWAEGGHQLKVHGIA